MSFSPTTPSLSSLLQMIAVRRPGRSKSERRWIREHIAPLGVTFDGYGNAIKRVGNSPILWSCHTDTVHRLGGVQALTVAKGMLTVATGDPSNCLGADCTAGVWVMREMILANVPGLYVFHRDEETGGNGSSWIARHTPELLDGIKAAIAFDRKGTRNVITHQGGRCCSDVFAKSLGDALKMDYSPDDTGIFTDTANYTDLVGECTNLSVGYYGEHSRGECLDLAHLVSLRAAVIGMDVDALVYSRQPGDPDPDAYGRRIAWYDGFKSEWDRDNLLNFTSTFAEMPLAEIIRDHPDEVADWLEHQGVDTSELIAAIEDRGAIVRRRK